LKNALTIEGLTKRFRGRTALDGLDLSVPAGSVLGLVGSNGAGKTTVLSIVAGLLRPTRGKIDILGDGSFDPRLHAGRVSFMPQDSDLPGDTKLIDLLSFYAELQGMPRESIEEDVDEVIEWVHLTDRRRSTMRTLSHGMRRRVVIAQAFLGKPELVLLDEPLSGLDPMEVVNMRNLLSSRKGQQTIVVSSHNLHEIQLICDQVAFLDHGRTMQQDTMDALTGRAHDLRYRLGAGDIPIEQLRVAQPDASFTLAREQGILTCQCKNEESIIADVNRTVLRCLLDANMDIIEMSQGTKLEEAYLGRRD
jgi:ABC-2 type transport system ATP-binding protein